MRSVLEGYALIRQRDLCALLNVSRSTLFRWERSGHFPRRMKLGPRRVAWRTSDIEAWLATRSASRGEV